MAARSETCGVRPSRARRLARRLVVGSLALAGCRTPPTTGGDESQPPTRDGAGIDGPVDRLSLAEAIDPGDRPPLSEGVPRFLLDAIGLPEPLPSDPEELVGLANAELEGWRGLEGSKDLQQSLAVIVGIARGVVFAERAVELGSRDTATLSTVERLYSALDAPMIANDRAFFPQMMQLFVQSSAQAGHITDQAAVSAFSEVVFGTLQRAGPAHRHAVAELLRSGDDPKLVADALERLAPKLRKEDDALGVRAMRASIALREDAVEPRHFVALADLCYAALDLPCGDEAAKRAEAGAAGLDAEAKAKLETSLKGTRVTASDAATVLSLRDAKDLDDRLRQARALLDLARHADAKAAYDRLRADFPHEARPVAGLARHAIVSGFDLVGASRIIEEAGPVEHADLDYYEIAIGCRATALIYDILPRAVAGKGFEDAWATLEPAFVDLRAKIAAYEALGADKGVVLLFLADLGLNEAVEIARKGDLDGAIPLLRGLLPRTLALVDRVPQSQHAYLLMAGSAQFSADPDAAFAALDRPLPPDPKHAVAMRRAIARYELVVTWDRPEGIEALLKDVADLRAADDTAKVQILEGDAHALVARLRGETGAWAKAEAAYRRAVGDPSTSTDARALNNLGVAVAEQGRKAEAMELWARAVAAGGDSVSVPTINLAATRGEPADLATLADQETAGDIVEARLLAMAWRAELSAPRERPQMVKALRAKVAEEIKGQLRPRVLPGDAGVALQGVLNFGLGYSTVEGLQLDLSTASQPWLAMRPATLPLDPRSAVRTRR